MRINKDNFPLVLIYSILFITKAIGFLDVSWWLLFMPLLGYVIYAVLAIMGGVVTGIGPLPILVILGLYYLIR